MQLVIGIITYGESTAKYLPYFLSSIKEQTTQDFTLLIYDNTDNGTTTNKELIDSSGLRTKMFGNGTNIGFGRAYNYLISRAHEMGAEYFLALNPDMIFEPTMVAELSTSLLNNDKAGAVAAKILRWDFLNQIKTKTIDSLGIVSDKYFRFFDDQQAKPDSDEFNKKREILAFTGAAVMLRLRALIDIKFGNEFFDEFMFMYKEDCDLSLRLRLAGWTLFLEPRAIAYHDRTAETIGKSISQIASGRKFKSKHVKQWSFLNQLILLYKFNNILPLRVQINAWSYEFLSIGYALIFETYLLRQLVTFYSIRKVIKIKSATMPISIDIKTLEKYFN